MEFFDTQNPTVLILLITLSLALVRILERLIDVVLKKKNGKKSIAPAPAGGCNGLTDEEHAALMRLDEMHAQKDQDGVPRWYFPRSVIKSMDEISKTMDRIAVRLRDVVKAQDAMNKRMSKWEDTTTRITVPRRDGR